MSENSVLLQPGEVIKPSLTSNDVPELLQRLYGIEITRVTELKSYDDKNFLIKVKASSNPHIPDVFEDGYVLKILNSLDSRDQEVVEGQNQMMLFLHKRGFNVPVPVPGINGQRLIPKQLSWQQNQDQNKNGKSSSTNIVRLLQFVRGKILFEVPYTKELFYQAGKYISQIDHELKDFTCPAIANRETIWMMCSTPQVRNFMHAVEDRERKRLVEEVLKEWDANVAPIMPKLEKGYIHGDYNEQNILVQKQEDGSYAVHGVIDFGDVSVSCYVFELAIIITYMMIEVKDLPWIEVGGHVIAGYQTVRKVPQQEWEILKECICGRLVVSLVMGAYTHLLDPGNDYLLVTAPMGWKRLQQVWETPKQDILNTWKKVLQNYNQDLC